MKNIKIQRALISVYCKDRIVELARYLSSNGVEIISTSKTASLLSENKIPVTKIEDVTKFPEIMGGNLRFGLVIPKITVARNFRGRLYTRRNRPT